MNKITWVIISAALIFGIAMFAIKCNPTPAPDPWQTKYDSLVNVVKAQQAEIEKYDELVKHYAEAYDSTAYVNDSLASVGVKTVVRYREVKVQSDTTELLAICDSLANEYEAFIDQTKVTLKAADSVIAAQAAQVDNVKDQNKTLRELVTTLEDKIKEQEREIDKWRKLAKRRGRAIEW